MSITDFQNKRFVSMGRTLVDFDYTLQRTSNVPEVNTKLFMLGKEPQVLDITLRSGKYRNYSNILGIPNDEYVGVLVDPDTSVDDIKITCYDFTSVSRPYLFSNYGEQIHIEKTEALNKVKVVLPEGHDALVYMIYNGRSLMTQYITEDKSDVIYPATLLTGADNMLVIVAFPKLVLAIQDTGINFEVFRLLSYQPVYIRPDYNLLKRPNHIPYLEKEEIAELTMLMEKHKYINTNQNMVGLIKKDYTEYLYGLPITDEEENNLLELFRTSDIVPDTVPEEERIEMIKLSRMMHLENSIYLQQYRPVTDAVPVTEDQSRHKVSIHTMSKGPGSLKDAVFNAITKIFNDMGKPLKKEHISMKEGFTITTEDDMSVLDVVLEPNQFVCGSARFKWRKEDYATVAAENGVNVSGKTIFLDKEYYLSDNLDVTIDRETRLNPELWVPIVKRKYTEMVKIRPLFRFYDDTASDLSHLIHIPAINIIGEISSILYDDKVRGLIGMHLYPNIVPTNKYLLTDHSSIRMMINRIGALNGLQINPDNTTSVAGLSLKNIRFTNDYVIDGINIPDLKKGLMKVDAQWHYKDNDADFTYWESYYFELMSLLDLNVGNLITGVTVDIDSASTLDDVSKALTKGLIGVTDDFEYYYDDKCTSPIDKEALIGVGNRSIYMKPRFKVPVIETEALEALQYRMELNKQQQMYYSALIAKRNLVPALLDYYKAVYPDKVMYLNFYKEDVLQIRVKGIKDHDRTSVRGNYV